MSIYKINQKKCTFCGGCLTVCPPFAIKLKDSEAVITQSCINCGKCYDFCPLSAVEIVKNRKTGAKE